MKNLPILQRVCLALALCLAMPIAMAVNHTPDLSGLSENLIAPMRGVGYAFFVACFLLGIGIFFGGLMQFKAHHTNPVQVPISRPIFLVILGLVLFFLPIIASMSPAVSDLFGLTGKFDWRSLFSFDVSPPPALPGK